MIMHASPEPPPPREVAGPPLGAIEVPRGLVDAVQALLGHGAFAPVWRNELGGLTWRLTGTDGAVLAYAKWAPAGSGLDLAREAARMRWASRWAVVPQPLVEGADEDGAWLVTRALPGGSAVDERWAERPHIAVPQLGRALRALHDALPVAECPFEWSAESRLARLRPDAPAEALVALQQVPPVDALVVCHGDACAPNTLLDDDGRWTGHVDLGALGTADRWADLAVATWSTEWNYGPGWEQALLDAYGVEADPVRIAYYRLLWDCT